MRTMSRDHVRRKGESSNSSSKLRMDSNPSVSRSRIDRSEKRKELDNVIRKARESHSNYWNKKLLEAEEKDPNRWRHSGYKEMYIGVTGGGDLRSHARSPRHRSPRLRSPRLHSPRSPRAWDSKSPCLLSPRASRPRTPKTRNSRSPRRKSPRISHNTRPRSPINKTSHSPRPRSPRIRRSHTPKLRISRENAHCTQTRIVKSPSSGSSCSDKSCSVCSPRNHPRSINASRSRSQSRSVSPVHSRHNVKEVPSSSTRIAVSQSTKPRSPPMPRPRTPPPMPQPPVRHPKDYNELTKDLKARKERYQSKLPEDPRIPESVQMLHKHVKVENTQIGHSDTSLNCQVAESSPSDDSDSSSATSHVPPPRMTLSERFGKMAQWSVDRRDMENMRITKIGNSAMKVVIEGEERIARIGYDSPPPGHYPDVLSAHGPRGLERWDDVRVRYDHYKSRGYLRDLTLEDYIKWEEWWYKYQEWLEAERYYEQWAAQATNRSAGSGGGGSVRKRRRRNNTAH